MKPRLFIGSSRESLAIARALQAELQYDAEPIVWNQGVFQPSSYTLDQLIKALDGLDFGAFVFSPDDVVRMRHRQYVAVRDNIIFELGLFIGKLGRERNFVIVPSGVKNFRLPTDLLGLTPATFELPSTDEYLQAALGPAANEIRQAMRNLGPLSGKSDTSNLRSGIIIRTQELPSDGQRDVSFDSARKGRGQMANRLLLADNNAEYRQNLRARLEFEGYQVVEADSVEDAIKKLAAVPLDLVLVDMKLTAHDRYDISGLEVAKSAFERGLPCIMMTGFVSEAQEAMRLALRSLGREPLAEDFVFKGDHPDAIVDAIAHVLGNLAQTTAVSTGLAVDLSKGLVTLNGVKIDLSAQQYKLLACLFGKQGAVCSGQEILKEIYGEDLAPEKASADKRLERLVARLRGKIEEDRNCPKHLITVPGRGFRLEIGP